MFHRVGGFPLPFSNWTYRFPVYGSPPVFLRNCMHSSLGFASKIYYPILFSPAYRISPSLRDLLSANFDSAENFEICMVKNSAVTFKGRSAIKNEVVPQVRICAEGARETGILTATVPCFFQFIKFRLDIF